MPGFYREHESFNRENELLSMPLALGWLIGMCLHYTYSNVHMD
jgi:hypothetical protein